MTGLHRRLSLTWTHRRPLSPTPSSHPLTRPWLPPWPGSRGSARPPLAGDPGPGPHLAVPTVTLAHGSEVHDGAATTQLPERVGPPGRSSERHRDTPQPARHGRRRPRDPASPDPGSVGFGTKVPARTSDPGRKDLPGAQASLRVSSPWNQWASRIGGGRQTRRGHWLDFPGARPIRGRQRSPTTNGERLRGREQRRKETLSPPFRGTWRCVKGVRPAAAPEGTGRRPRGLRPVVSTKGLARRR